MMKWIVAFLAVVAVTIFFGFLKKRQDDVEERFRKRFAGQNIRLMDKYALYVAQESDGYSHFRGSGYLVLTDQELYFERQLKRKVVSIPVNAIVQVGETMRLGGQSPGKRMLRVDFWNGQGRPDAIAWRVKEIDRWQQELSALISE